jgi:hypothetical protein
MDIGEPCSRAWTRFVRSLEGDFDAWHDGTGYDLAALGEMNDVERAAVRELIARRLGNRSRIADWRDLEAAAALGLTELIALRANDEDPQTRLRAKEVLGDREAVIAELCEIIANSTDVQAVTRALDRVGSFPEEAVERAVITRVRRMDSQFIDAAMVLLQVFGGVEDPFAERQFLFAVQAQGRAGELLEKLIGRVRETAGASRRQSP